MKVENIPHGTRSGHAWWGCDCDPCYRAFREYHNTRRRLMAYGRWQPTADTAPLQTHIAELRAQGLTLERIASLAGVKRNTVAAITRRDPTQPTRRTVAEKILAVTSDPDPVDVSVPAFGSRRRLQALACLGHSSAAVARAAGIHTSTARRVAAGSRDRVMRSVAVAVAAVYDELSMTFAPPGKGATYARNRAAREGWLPPLAWDDDWLDLPDEDLETELARLAGLMDPAELRRCYLDRLGGGRSLLVNAAADRYLEWRREQRAAA